MPATISALMKRLPTERDLSWLRSSLQVAAMLELATLPPYLVAYWSIKDAKSPAARAIRPIIMEEMLHLGLVCNLLSAIGGAPVLTDPTVLPKYPDALPGGVIPGLELSLRGFSRDAIADFMKVEYPADGPVALFHDKSYPTIGAFYDAISAALIAKAPELKVNTQQSGSLGLTHLTTLDEALAALALIKRQGEGSASSPVDTGLNDLAHYYRFAELFHQHRIVLDDTTGDWSYTGEIVQMPDVWPVGVVPAGGYAQQDVTPAVWALLSEFDREYTAMLRQLSDAWRTGDPDFLGQAESTMSIGLTGPAEDLVKIQIPNQLVNYAPCFRFIA